MPQHPHGRDCNCDSCVMDGSYIEDVTYVEDIQDQNPMRES